MENFEHNKIEQCEVNNQAEYAMAKAAYKTTRRYNREPLIFALLGMAFSFIYGVGIVFAIIAFVMSVSRYIRKPSKTLKWAVIISIVCIVLCVLYIAGVCYAVSVAPPPQIEENF